MQSLPSTFLLVGLFIFFSASCIEPDEDANVETEVLLENSGQDTLGDKLNTVPTSFRVSDCGGFRTNFFSGNLFPLSDTGYSYCDAEVLKWFFDASTNTVHLSHNRVSLVCCGEFSVQVVKEGDRYVVKELDNPDAGCRCMCVYDFEAHFEVDDDQFINLVVEHQLTDNSSQPYQIFSGQLNLQEGAGIFIIDDRPLMNCE